MYRVVAHLAHRNRLLHLLFGEVPLPPIFSMTVTRNQMMFAVNFVDPAELARHFCSPYISDTSRIRFYFNKVSSITNGVSDLMLWGVLAAI
jgi:hypothetical protein